MFRENGNGKRKKLKMVAYVLLVIVAAIGVGWYVATQTTWGQTQVTKVKNWWNKRKATTTTVSNEEAASPAPETEGEESLVL